MPESLGPSRERAAQVRPARRGAPGSVTIRDVARHAGVSIATVSRALRDSDLVHPDTRRRVTAAAAELRFTPSRLGRSLAERRHAANGIVFPDLSGPYYADVVLGYEEVAASLGRSVLILSTHNRESADEMVRELATRVDGLAVFGRTVHDPVITEIVDRGVPVVLMARHEVEGADSVRTENTASAAALVEHLVGHGHRRFAFLGDPVTSPDVAERWDAFRRTLAAAGLDAPRTPIGGGFKEDDGAAAAATLLGGGSGTRLASPAPGRRIVAAAPGARGTRAEPADGADRTVRVDRPDGADGPDGPDGGLPDVVVCANDELALGLMVALDHAGVRVPDDVAVTGWDDVMAARFAGLTTVRQPMRDMGARAAHLLDARIAGDRDEPHRGRPQHQILPTEPVVRRSCGPHPQEDRR